MKPKSIKFDFLVKIENYKDVEGLINISQHFQECILVFITCTTIERQKEEKICGNEDSEVKNESNEEDLTDFRNNSFRHVNLRTITHLQTDEKHRF